MKFNWGTGIVLTLVIFVSGMALLIWISVHSRLNLVSENYYSDGIAYDSQIDKINNTNKLVVPLSFEMVGENLVLQFPKMDSLTQPSGNILAYRPSDDRLDKKIEIKVDNSLKQIIPLSNFYKGKYIFKIDWQQDNIKYYQEFIFNL